jgi:uncharacterized protein
MHIQLETGGNANLIRTYGPGQIVVNDQQYRTSLIVLPERIVTDWPPQSFQELAPEHMQALATLDREIILIGTGRRLRFPSAELLAPMAQAGIGWEIMDTGAACRTYNVLVNEGRKVVAALLMIEE